MLHFEKLQKLHDHRAYLSSIMPDADVFFVGGSIRDLLLDINDDPTDIDLTMAGNPTDIREDMHFDETTMSRFKTDKYGTMTIIPKHTESSVTGPSLPTEISYEITPLRTEGGYTDLRHPEEITRSDDIIADSKRRDFTINCIYRYGVESSYKEALEEIGKSIPAPIKPGGLKKVLKDQQDLFLIDANTLIIQNPETASNLFANGSFQEGYLKELCKNIPVFSLKSRVGNLESNMSILVDLHGGLLDLLNRKIRTVGNPDDRFTEDALRVLRGVRFPNILNQQLPDKELQNSGFDYDKTTWESMQTHAHLVEHLAKERIHQELVKVFSADNPFGYVSLLNELGLLDLVFPALAACKGNDQPIRYHPFDTFNHTLLCIHAIQQLNTHYLVKLAMVYHDVGKPEQYAYISEQKEKNPENIDMSGYVHHAESGAETAKHELNHLGFSKKEVEETCRYIRWHHRPGELLEGKSENIPKRLRKMMSEVGHERLLNLMDIAIADRQGQFNPMQSPAIAQLQEMKQTVQDLYEQEGRFTMKDLAIDGNILMKELDLQPGPELGKYLQKAFDRVIDNIEKRNEKKMILEHLRNN